MRLLVVAERDELHLLVRKHAEIAWPDVSVLQHRLGTDADFEPSFAAAGVDAVVIVASPPTTRSDEFAVGLLTRAEFAPIVLLLLEDAPSVPPPVVKGLRRLYGRKVDREALLDAITAAAEEHKKALAQSRTRTGAEHRYRFGTVQIRGHRCIRQVGSGGMCTIYLAESERAGSVVVLKVFSQVPDVSERLVSFDRFLQEYEIVAGLKHGNIVRIYDLGVADDHAYIAMEHFPKGDLRQRLRTRVSPSEALNYVRQIASALDAIHSVGIMHRDLKPANVMLRADGTICLIDFGLAKAAQYDAELTGTREIFGTPYYMSPEQGHAEDIDARSDLYSLGIVFYEMLAGSKPFTGSNAMEVIYKHKRAEVPALAPQHADYDGILRRLLAKAPRDRFQTASELLDALAKLDAPA